jgi:hypothetical protein
MQSPCARCEDKQIPCVRARVSLLRCDYCRTKHNSCPKVAEFREWKEAQPESSSLSDPDWQPQRKRLKRRRNLSISTSSNDGCGGDGDSGSVGSDHDGPNVADLSYADKDKDKAAEEANSESGSDGFESKSPTLLTLIIFMPDVRTSSPICQIISGRNQMQV